MSIRLARRAIQNLVPYSCARVENTQKGIQLDANENPYEREAGLNRYPEPQPLKLGQTLADYYGIKPSQLLMTRGSNEGIDLLVRTFCEAGQDGILITPPTYGMYEISAAIQGASIFRIDFDTILNQWQPCIKLIFLCSPNNPTGHVLPVKKVLELCEQLQNKAIVVVDEAYVEFSSTKSFNAYIEKYPNLVVLRTFSKAFGLAGIRFGILLAQQELIALLSKVIAPYPIPKPVEDLALKYLSDQQLSKFRQQIQCIKEEREKMKAFLLMLPSVEKVYPSEANFLLVKVDDAEKWMSVCAANHIIIRSRQSIPGLINCVRLSIGTRQENEKLREVLKNV